MAPMKEGFLYWLPTGPNPLHHRDDEVDQPCAMGVEMIFSGWPYIYFSSYAMHVSLSLVQAAGSNPARETLELTWSIGLRRWTTHLISLQTAPMTSLNGFNRRIMSRPSSSATAGSWLVAGFQRPPHMTYLSVTRVVWYLYSSNPCTGEELQGYLADKKHVETFSSRVKRRLYHRE